MSSTDDKGAEKTLIDMPFHWKESGLNVATKNIRFVSDGEGGIWAYPTIITGANPDNNEVRVNDIGKANSDTVLTSQIGILVRSADYVIKPGAIDYFERVRTPSIFKSVTNITNTANIWDPAAGKRIRLMGLTICSAGAAKVAAGMLTLNINDGTNTLFHGVYLPAAASAPSGFSFASYDFRPNGWLLVVDATLVATFSVPLTVGEFTFTAWGTEE